MLAACAPRPPRPPVAVAFDVFETLLSLEPVRRAIGDAGGGDRGFDLFFCRLLRDGFALSAAGRCRPFVDLAASAAGVALPGARPSEIEAVVTAFSELPAHDDAKPALAKLAADGRRVVTLSNGAAPDAERLLDRCGLGAFVEAVFSSEVVGRWKPAPTPYVHVAAALGIPAAECGFVAVHAWDIAGAAACDFVTGWASRLEGTFSPVFGRPDVSGADLVDVADGLLALA